MITTTIKPEVAISQLVDELESVSPESVDITHAPGRVLAEPVRTDRDSPPHDVSSMDGYAVRLADIQSGQIPVAGEVITGQAPPALPPGCAMRIFTGGCVPAEADVVIKREDTEEHPDHIELTIARDLISKNLNIRRQGENQTKGATVIKPGCAMTPAVSTALASFGIAQPILYRRVRLSLLITGNELQSIESTPEPWQIRDSNGPALANLFGSLPWIEIVTTVRCMDDEIDLTTQLDEQLATCDAVIITGGVSMGDYDFVPDAIKASGCSIKFHRLPMRPGKPLLGAVGPKGQVVMGLPGNPVSVMVTARRFASVALRKRAGFADPDPLPQQVTLNEHDQKLLNLWWYRPVRLVAPGVAELVSSKGSGDIVSAAQSDGFLQIAPESTDPGPWPYWEWTLK